MDASFSAIGLLQEAKARARYHDDWEREVLEELRQRMTGWLAALVASLRQPALRFEPADA